MNWNLEFKLPAEWKLLCHRNETDADGNTCTHLSAENKACGIIDIYVGEMPEGETAEDQAFANYAESVGFDEDDPGGFNPIFKTVFNGKNAWGFDASGDNDSSIRILCQEVKKGILAVFCMEATDDSTLSITESITEKSFRIKS